MNMETNPKDRFIYKLKNNLISSNNFQNSSLTNNNITNISIPPINKNVNELLNDEELGKKIGRMETILNYYEAKLKNEFNERKLLEDKVESLSMDVYHMRENFDNLSKLFSENFSKIKNNIIENVENKNNSVNKILLESTKRINNLEDIILNNNNIANTNNNNINLNNNTTNIESYNFKSLQNFDNLGINKSINNSILFNTQRDSSFMKTKYISMQNNIYDNLLNKIDKVEKIIHKKGNYLGREEEINVAIEKVNYLEKKFENFLNNFNHDINVIKENIKNNMDNISHLSSAHNVLNEKYDNLYKTFNDTNANINKFNYHSTILLNETQKKIEEYTDYFNETKINLNKMKTDLNEEYSILKQILNDKINEYEKNSEEFKNLYNKDINEFKMKIEEKQENFLHLIQDEKDCYLSEAKKIQNNIGEQCNEIKKEYKVMNNNINEIKDTFFHNLNEIEQYFNKKYQNLYRVMNLQEN